MPPRLSIVLALATLLPCSAQPIDRHSLVTRHNLTRSHADALVFRGATAPGALGDVEAEPRFAPLQVGNGTFAFSVDVTGLQTFIPCQTFAHWGWHSEPAPAGQSPDDFEWIKLPVGEGDRRVPFAWIALSPNDAHGDQVHPMSEEQRRLGFWIRANPHLLNLGRAAMVLTRADGTPAALTDLQAIDQQLDLWRGVITSRFTFDGAPVEVLTRAHPERDAVAVRVTSPLIGLGRLHVSWKFPYGDSRKQAADVGEWHQPERHRTEVQPRGAEAARLVRTLDDDKYLLDLSWSPGGSLTETAAHAYALRPSVDAEAFWFVSEFSPHPAKPHLAHRSAHARAALSPLDDAGVHAATVKHWPEFWQSGGAIDFSRTHDPRAAELERRIVLSQYLMAVQEAGPWPPQEAGLVNLGWHGKFHLEMYLWHAAHYALWDRWPLLERSLDYYDRTLPQARELARRQGYPGARWPKQVGPDGRQTPSSVSPLLIWQQPHPLFFAELEWRARPTRATLERWSDVVFATAEFMAALPVEKRGSTRLHLGPPLKTVSENSPAAETWDPVFELSYWRFGLRIAQTWRERLGLPREAAWDAVLARLAPLPEKDGRYLLSATQPDTYERWAWEHPAIAGVFGLLPGEGVERETMRRSLDSIMETWDFARVWGWDFPMLAMSAARLGQSERAVELLLHASPNFQFADNGLATGGPWPYFPSNGGLLYAAALMAAGWDGAPERSAPGFPADWAVQWEGLRRAP
jgi:hypothetical protein